MLFIKQLLSSFAFCVWHYENTNKFQVRKYTFACFWFQQIITQTAVNQDDQCHAVHARIPREIGSRVTNPPRNLGERMVNHWGWDRADSLLLSICMPSVTRSAFIVLSSWRYTGGLFPLIYFSAPNKRSFRSHPFSFHFLLFPLKDTLKESARSHKIPVRRYHLLTSMISIESRWKKETYKILIRIVKCARKYQKENTCKIIRFNINKISIL